MKPNFLKRSAAALLMSLGLAAPGAAQASACGAWPAWETFRDRFMNQDGRIVDPRLPEKLTVSEAQAYAMLFALIGNDRAGFERLLAWTRDNLARGDLSRHLPAWKWGQTPEGGWGVLDPNSASDADVWMAYALIEAARLWNEPRYDVLGDALAKLVLRDEVRTLPGLGPTLIPAPIGFVFPDRYRLNHSYLAPQPLRLLARRQPDAEWKAVLRSGKRILLEGSPRGIAPDWALWQPGTGFIPDDEVRRLGSYDAIRVYLWVGLLDAGDPDRAELLARYAPIRGTLDAAGIPAEKVDTVSGAMTGHAPGAYSASLLPFFTAAGDVSAATSQYLRLIQRRAAEAGVYYDQALRLFGEGHWEGAYRFAADGTLMPRWAQTCRIGPLR